MICCCLTQIWLPINIVKPRLTNLMVATHLPPRGLTAKQVARSTFSHLICLPETRGLAKEGTIAGAIQKDIIVIAL